MNYWDAFIEFMIYLKPIESIDYEYPILIFLSASLIFNSLVILVDKSIHFIKKDSILGIAYTGNHFILLFLCWVFAGTAVSYFGLIFEILNTTIQSCAVVGFSWLYIFANLVKKYSAPEIEQD